MAPKPKIPPEYAKVAKKLSSEIGDDVSKVFDAELEKLAADLSGNLDSRSEPLQSLEYGTVRAAGVLNKVNPNETKIVNTESTKDLADFEVGMDELLAGFKEPKAVEGTGVMKPNPKDTGLNRPVDYDFVTPPESYDSKTGVLMGDEAGKYTPNATYPTTHQYPLTPRGGEGRAYRTLQHEGLRSEDMMGAEIDNSYVPGETNKESLSKGINLFANDNRFDSGGNLLSAGIKENIPTIAAGTVGAGVLLSSQNAQAKEMPLDKELQLETNNTTVVPKVDLLKKADEKIKTGRDVPSGSVTQEGNTSTIIDEIDNLANRAKHNLTSFVKDLGSAYSIYQAEKDSLNIRAQEWVNATEAKGAMLSDDDKALMNDFLGVVEGSPSVALGSAAGAVSNLTSKFNHEVLQPIKHKMQDAYRAYSEEELNELRHLAPSLAAQVETTMYPFLGSTGWNVSGDKLSVFNSDEENQKGLEQLDPTVKKMLDDKATLLGKNGGQALLTTASAWSDLPLWIFGGSSKTSLFLSGVFDAALKEDKDILEGGALAVGFGKAMEKVIAPVAKTGLNLLRKVRLDSSGVIDAFGKVTYDSNSKHVKKLFEALIDKNSVDPLIMMTGKTAGMLADDAALKVRPDVSEAMNTQVIAPQALVLGIEPATGKPKLYGVKDGHYGELNEFVNPEGRPVLINQIAKDEWMNNDELRSVWNKLIDPKRKTPPTTKHGMDEWTPDVIPPENPALIFAWKQFADSGKGGVEVLRGNSRDFAKDMLRSRSLVRVEYDGPNGEPTTGLGFWGGGGDVVFAPDVSDGIPGAIPKDLTFKQVRLNPNVPATKPLPPENMAWEIHQLTDDEMYGLVDNIKASQTLSREAAEETARGGLMPDGVPTPDKRPPNEFDVEMNALGPAVAMAGGALADNPNATGLAAAAISFLPPAKRAIGKALTKMNNAAGTAGLISDTVYGEVFKVDASIQAYSLRHYKRLTEDLNKQLIDSFRNVKGNTPLAHKQFDDSLRYFIENHQPNAPAPMPPQLNGVIQQKVQKFVAERNLDYAVIESLGGTVPDKAPGGNAELERMFALEFFREGNVGYEKEAMWLKLYNRLTGHKTTDNQWLERMRKRQPQFDGVINLLQNKEASKNVSKTTRAYDQLMGRMSTEMEMADDYMQRKLQISQLGFMKELADNTMASSPVANQALGHTRQVTINGSGPLKGKYVSDETFKAIHTYPKDQEMIQNTLLGVVNMIKFNKTVLNPTTWVKNIMGNVWGVMNSNIIPSWAMHRLPIGVRQMNKDLAVYNKDVMANDPAVHRVHETLKFGLLGAEFESSRTKMLDVLDNLAEPMAQTSNRTWGEKIANGYFLAKDATLGGLAHTYSKVDMATKYSLYVNGLERWGIDLATNKLHYLNGRARVADLLGANVANNFTISEDVLTEMAKREIVRRIHLSLPMVDRIGAIPTALNKLSPITNPWLRTASELTRITLQMPYRMYNEKGYAVNSLKTASFLGTILGVNKALRLSEGISDEMVDDAKNIAPRNVKDYMPGATATKFYAGEGKDRGLVFVDMANGLIEPAQWFKGGEVSNGTDVAKRIGANGIDLIMGGGLLQEESKDAQAALGLTDSAQNYSIPFWKQGDTLRWLKQKAVSAGPAFMNTSWQLYSTQNMPDRKGVRGKDMPEQPLSMQILKSIGIPVATMGSEKQKEYQMAELKKQKDDLKKAKPFAGKQREGSPTGAFQDPYSKKLVREKADEKIKSTELKRKKISDSDTVDDDDKPSLLTKDNLLTKHL